MDVQAAEPGLVQHPLRQDQAVGRDHHGIGPGRFQGGARGGSILGVLAVQPQPARLRHGNAVGQRALLDGGRLQLHAPAGGAVGLGEHEGNFGARGEQAFQGHPGELGRARENDLHGNGKRRAPQGRRSVRKRATRADRVRR